MSWFGNRNREGHEVKPKNQILQTPEFVTPKSKEKLQKSWELSPEKKNEINDGQKKLGEKYSKLDKPNTSSEGNDKGQLERDITKESNNKNEIDDKGTR